MTYWTGLLNGGAGVPRSVVMYTFLFSDEFKAYMASLPGSIVSRPENYVTVDFYRGALGRLPEDDGTPPKAGFAYWLYQFQASQCLGAQYVYNSVENISSGFFNSSEYAGRNRSDTEYVSDLYYAFMRRGADLAGFQFWLNQLTAKTQTRNQLRQAFITSAEFTARVNAIVGGGCVASPTPCALASSVKDVPASCSTTVTAACNVTLTLACTGGTPTGYGWGSSN